MNDSENSIVNTFTPQDFYDWVNLQDPKEELDHDFWETCAVGLYSSFFGIPHSKIIAAMLRGEDRDLKIINILNWAGDSVDKVALPYFSNLQELINDEDSINSLFNTYSETNITIPLEQYRL